MKILKNIKYNGKPYKIGEIVEIEKDDINLFIEKEIISNDYIEVKEIGEVEVVEEHTTKELEDSNIIAYNKLTKTEIGELLSEKGIGYNSRDSKDNLVELLLGSD